MAIFLSALPRAGDFLEYMLLEDSEGKLDAFVEQMHSPQLKQAYFGRNAASTVNRGNNTYIPNYPATPTPKLNQLVIPTGATRWSYCLLLADDALRKKIYDYSASQSAGLFNLTFTSEMTGRDEVGQAVSITGHVLPPWPITPPFPVKIMQFDNGGYQQIDDPKESGLWVIPFVDERYYWQFQHTGTELDQEITDALDTIPDGDNTTRSRQADEILTVLTDKAGSRWFNCGAHPLHIETPTCVMTNNWENLPIVIDSAAIHYGQIVVPDISTVDVDTGSYNERLGLQPRGRTRYALIDGESSVKVHDSCLQGKIGLQANLWNGAQRANAESQAVGVPLHMAGGQSTGPKKLGGLTVDNAKLGSYRLAPNEVQVGTVAGEYDLQPATVMGTDFAIETRVAESIWRLEWESVPTSTAIQRCAKEYYFQFYRLFDYTFAGVQPWQQTFFDDYMVIRQTYNCKTKGYDVYTRVCSRLPNIVGEFTGDPGSGFREAVLAGDMSAPSNSLDTMTSVSMHFIRRKLGGLYELDPDPFIGYNHDPGLTGARGTYCRVQRLSGVWLIYYLGCDVQSALITALDALED